MTTCTVCGALCPCADSSCACGPYCSAECEDKDRLAECEPEEEDGDG